MTWVKRRKRKPKRRGYVRPSRAKPKAGWTLGQLASLAGVTVRTVRLYLQLGVLPRPRFAGPATRYERSHLVRLLAIRRLQITDRSLSLSSIPGRLSALSVPELEALATEALPPGATADALGVQLAPATVAADVAGTMGGRVPALTGPRWVRHELALGLELSVREDASASVIEMARRIRELCNPSDTRG